MASTHAVLVITAALSLMSLHFKDSRAEDAKVCPANSPEVALAIDSPGSTISLKCDSGNTFNPPQETVVENVFCDKACIKPEPLSEVCPGATGTESDGTLSLSFPQLPTNTTTIYLQCKQGVGVVAGKQGGKICTFVLTVQEPAPGGPQVCAVKGSTVALYLHGEDAKAQFACGSSMSLKGKEDLTKVYNENCEKEEHLKDMKLALEGSYYVLRPTKKPHNKTLCYVCVGDNRNKQDECKILIHASTGARAAALSVFGLALPCVLMLLQLA